MLLWKDKSICSILSSVSQTHLGEKAPKNCCIYPPSLHWAKWPIRPELILVSEAWSNSENFYPPLDGMLVHHRVTPSIKFTVTHLWGPVRGGLYVPRLNFKPFHVATLESSHVAVRILSSGLSFAVISAPSCRRFRAVLGPCLVCTWYDKENLCYVLITKSSHENRYFYLLYCPASLSTE